MSKLPLIVTLAGASMAMVNGWLLLQRLTQQEQHINAVLDAIRKRQEHLEEFAAQLQTEKESHSSSGWRLWGSKA